MHRQKSSVLRTTARLKDLKLSYSKPSCKQMDCNFASIEIAFVHGRSPLCYNQVICGFATFADNILQSTFFPCMEHREDFAVIFPAPSKKLKLSLHPFLVSYLRSPWRVIVIEFNFQAQSHVSLLFLSVSAVQYTSSLSRTSPLRLSICLLGKVGDFIALYRFHVLSLVVVFPINIKNQSLE